ncbi:MAG: ABC transporter permease [Symbiobacteriaceae bacterium]|nr:ABC transporter permease [Symbiobacteriaceae bacterium]
MEVKRVFSLLGLYARMDLAWFLRDTKHCLICILGDLLSNIAAISGVFLLALRFQNFGGMNDSEVLFMLSYLMAMSGIQEIFLRNCNVSYISRRIGRGQLEHMLLLPLPLPLQLLTEGFIPFSGNGTLISGFILLRYSLLRLELQPHGWWWLSLTGSLVLSVVTVIGASYLFATSAFYAPVACEEISSRVFGVADALKIFPLSGMPLGLQITLCSVLPVGLLGWFPCLALLGKAPLGLPGWFPLAFAATLWLITLTLFKKGLRHYASIGINRYSAIGHRR